MADYEYNARVVRIVDGDTFDADVDLGFHLTSRLRFRLLGIDAPEMRESAGPAAKAWLTEAIPVDKAVHIRTEKGDSFGRWLAVVYGDAGLASVNDQMVAAGHAVPWKRK